MDKALKPTKYTYSEVSKIIGATERTVRHWITEGLIDKPEVIDGRNKFFSEDQLQEILALHWLLKTKKQSIKDVSNFRQMIIDSSETTPKYPLSIIKKTFFIGVLPESHEDVKQVIHYFIEKKIVIGETKYGQMVISPKAPVFQNSNNNYRYFDTPSSNEITEEYFEANRKVFVGEDELITHFEEEYNEHREINSYMGKNYENSPTPEDRLTMHKSLISEGLINSPQLIHDNRKYFHKIEFECAEIWESFYNDYEKDEREKLRQLRKEIESNIIEFFPYGILFSMHCSIKEPPQITQIYLETFIKCRILQAISMEYNAQGSKFIDLYIMRFYYAYPEFCNYCKSWKPEIKKRQLKEIGSAVLNYADKFGIYSNEEIIREAEQRIDNNREEIRTLRYQVLKNIKRRKKK